MRLHFCKCRLACGWMMLAGCLLASHPVRAAAEADSHAECEVKIEKLEQRVVALEGLVAALIARDKTHGSSESSDRENSAGQPSLDASTQRAAHIPNGHNRKFETPPELVPEIGKIGAEVGLLLSGSSSPFNLDRGGFVGGFIDLPLIDRPAWLHGKLSYEISIGLSRSKTTFATTSNVAQVSNLAVLTALNPSGGIANLTAAVSGTGPAPFPVTVSTETRLRLLQVVPFSLKYTTTALDHWRLRPYGILGFGTYVTIHVQNPAHGTPATFGVRQDAALPPDVLNAVNQLFGGKAPFGGPLVAGQISQAPELEARGLPGGHGNVDLGIHSGAGFEFRVSRNLSLGFDARFNRIAGANGYFQTYGTRIALHF